MSPGVADPERQWPSGFGGRQLSNTTVSLRLFALAVLAIHFFWRPAAAQTEDEPKVKLPPVVVVGSNLQRSPLSVTTLSGDRLHTRGVLSTVDLQRVVPNLSQHHAGLRSFSDNYAIRGIGNTEFLSDPAVVLYVDDAPFGDNVTYTTDLLAIESVDVYRGTQGSRFGKNAAAGVINIVTRRITDRFGAEGSVSGSSFNTWQYRTAVQGPVLENRLGLSLAGQYGVSDGFIRNGFRGSHADERKAFNGRAGLSWTPREYWDVSLTATFDKFDDGLGIVSLGGDPRVTTSDLDGKIESDANSQSLRVRGTLSGLTFTSVTTRRDFQLDPFLVDPDFSPFPGNVGIVTYALPQWTQELRVRPATVSEGWNMLGGLFFSTAKTEINRTVDFVVPGLGAGRDVTLSKEDGETYALFGECGRAWEKLETTVGLRLDYSRRELRRARTSTLGSPPPVSAADGFFNAAPKLTVGYRASDEALLYGSTGLGFKPGGFSGFIDPPASPRFDTETTWENELGVKATGPEGNLTANLSLFYYDVDDYQVEQQTPGGLGFTIANAPEARSLGGELELNARSSSGWELSGFLGYTDVRLRRYTDPFTGTTVTDKRAPFVARLNGGAAAQYRHTTGLFARIEGVAVGETFYEATNDVSYKQGPYELLNARVGLERGTLGIHIFGENLSDAEYFQKKIPPLNAGAPGRPRSIGVMITGRY